MCGRFNFDGGTVDIKDIIDELNRKYGPGSVKTGEVFPTDSAAVLVPDGDVIAPVPMIWGFPKWQGSGVIFNARAETAHDKPMFRSSLELRRCIVPSSGYYEWRKLSGSKKEKNLFIRPDSGALYMAALWNTFTTADGSEYPAFTILTTSANASAAEVHERMPVLLDSNEKAAWLSDSQFANHAVTRPGLEVAYRAV